MYKFEFKGCLPILLIGALLLFIALKLWFLFVLVFLYFLAKNFISRLNINLELKRKEKEINFTPNKGEVYKLCPACGTKVKRSCEECPNCGRQL